MAIYNELKHGKILSEHTGYTLCILPSNHNNRTESYLTKHIKNFYKAKGYFEEVCVWEQNFIQKICVIDLYNPSLDVGIEIHNKNKSNVKKLINRLNLYVEYFHNVKIIMLENHPLITERLSNYGFECISIPKEDRPTLMFPLENLN